MQTHKPRDCPYGKGGSKSLFDDGYEGVKIVSTSIITPVTDEPVPPPQ